MVFPSSGKEYQAHVVRIIVVKREEICSGALKEDGLKVPCSVLAPHLHGY